jgi:hypothetical protein
MITQEPDSGQHFADLIAEQESAISEMLELLQLTVLSHLTAPATDTARHQQIDANLARLMSTIAQFRANLAILRGKQAKFRSPPCRN